MRRHPHKTSRLLSSLPLSWIIAWRYLRGERSRALSATALAAWAATALGVTAMVVTMALMTGYTEDLQQKLVGLQGEIVLSSLHGDSPTQDLAALDELAEMPGVLSLRRVAYGEGSLSGPERPEGVSVVLRGIELSGPLPDGRPARLLAAEDDDLPGVLLGRELARSLGVSTGDALRLVVLDVGGRRPAFRFRSVRCRGTFQIGFSEFDSRWVLLDREVLLSARGETGLDLIELEIEPPDATEPVALRAEELLGENWLVQRWQNLNRDLFAALALQKLVLFIVLGLIVLVSTFNVASTLMILIRERLAEIGVLGSLGMEPRRLRRAFILYGVVLGAGGIVTGLIAGTTISWCITTFELIRFPPEVAEIYFISSVPFRVLWSDLAGIAIFSLLVTVVACSLPAARAARVRPSAALRHE